MKTPFPGMDPYLEQPGVWNQIHSSLIIDIQRFLAPLIQPNYKIIIEHLTYMTMVSANGEPEPPLVGQPDNLVVSPKSYQPAPTTARAVSQTTFNPLPATLPMPIEEIHRYLEIRDKDDEVITVIEILSPTNKRGEGRKQYLDKRLDILRTYTNLVEIDLLRQGHPLPMQVAAENDYRIIVSRRHQRPVADAYLFSMRDPIPDFPIPLRRGEEEPLLKLNDILHKVYELGYYATFVDYETPLQPPLSDEALTWVTEIKTQ